MGRWAQLSKAFEEIPSLPIELRKRLPAVGQDGLFAEKDR
jgi:hypothetical protein